MNLLSNKVAVVTGGNSGIGYSTAQELAAQGARVIITGRNKETLAKAAADLGVTGYASDQGSLKDIDLLVEEIKINFGHVDILVVNAGVAAFSPVDSASEEHYDSVMDLNVKGAFFTVQKFLPILQDGGSIIFTNSVNAVLGMPNSSVYAASKAALLSFARVLSKEVSPRGIRVNSLVVGPVATPLYGKLGLSSEQLDGMGQALGQKILLGRFGQPDEIAKAIKFLASAEASFITGAELTIDGGLTVNAVLS